MKKKVSLAAAIIHNPALLILDEPFEGIDPVAARDIIDALVLMASKGTTVLITSHILDTVERVCSHLGIIHNGRMILECGMDEYNVRAEDLLQHSATAHYGICLSGSSAITGGSLRSRMSDYLLPFLALARPRTASRAIPRVLAWWRPLVAVALCAVCVGVAGHSIITTAVVAHLPRSATPEDIIQVRAWLDADLLPRTLLLPSGLGRNRLWGIPFAAPGQRLPGGTGEAFKGYFVLSLVASAIPLFGRLAGIVVTLTRGAHQAHCLRPRGRLPASSPGNKITGRFFCLPP